MLRVRRLELREIALPLREPFRISSGEVTDRRILLVRLTDEDGNRAWSECVAGEAPNYSPETIDTAWLVLEQYVAPRIVGTELSCASAVHAHLDTDFRGHNMAKASVEMGCWVLEAEAAGVSLARHLGGVHESVPVGISIGIQSSPEALGRKVREALDAGYRKVKMKIAPQADLAYVRAARAAAGPEGPLAVDANCAYTLEDLDLLRALDGLDLLMIEQPLDPEDLLDHAELQKALDTPLCLDESITSPAKARAMVRLDSGRIVNIKPGRVGGFTPSLAIHDICVRASIPVWCGGMLESGVGRAHNVALASLNGFTLPGDLSPSSRYWERDIVDPEWRMEEDGTVRVPRDLPGIGVAVDEGRVDDLTVRRAEITADRL